MTDQDQTITEQTADAAGVAQEKPADAPAPEVPAETAAAPAAPETAPDAPEVAAAEFPDDEPAELQPGQTLHALRGIPAGPADHPRLVHHRKTHPPEVAED